MPLAADSIVRRNPDMLLTEVPGGYLALEMTRYSCLSFTGSAGRIWELIETPIAVDAICDQLRREYRVDEQVCLSETLAHLERLRAACAVEIVHARA
jgi:hypothetical protein